MKTVNSAVASQKITRKPKNQGKAEAAEPNYNRQNRRFYSAYLTANIHFRASDLKVRK